MESVDMKESFAFEDEGEEKYLNNELRSEDEEMADQESLQQPARWCSTCRALDIRR